MVGLVDSWKAWTAFYFISAGGFLVLGFAVLGLPWYGAVPFALLASGSVTCAALEITRSRLCPIRVRRALAAGCDPGRVQAMMDKAFGSRPQLVDAPRAGRPPTLQYGRPADGKPLNYRDVEFEAHEPEAMGAQILGFVPLVMVFYWLWVLVLGGRGEPLRPQVRLVIAGLAAVPAYFAAVHVPAIVCKAGAMKAMFQRVRDVVTGHDPHVWSAMKMVWVHRHAAEAAREEQEAAAYRAHVASEEARQAEEEARRAAEAAKRRAKRIRRGYCATCQKRFGQEDRDFLQEVMNRRAAVCPSCGREYCVGCVGERIKGWNMQFECQCGNDEMDRAEGSFALQGFTVHQPDLSFRGGPGTFLPGVKWRQ